MDLIGKVKQTDPGTIIRLQTSDAGSKNDVPEWLEEAGHELLAIEEEADHWNIYIETT